MRIRAIATQSFVGVSLLAGTVASAQDQELAVREHANVQMMIESMLHGLHMQTEGDPWETCRGGDLRINGRFDGQGWTATAQGAVCGGVMSVDYFGDLTETPDGFESRVQGSGSILDEEWHSTIDGIWGTDADGNLMTLDYREVADDGGSLKPKWWVYAGEILLGGALGSVGGLGAGTVVGAGAAVNISNAVSSKAADPGVTPPPPGGDVVIELHPAIGDDQVVISVLGTGDIAGNRSNHIRFEGTWRLDPGTSSGEVIGTVTFLDTGSCYADMDGDGLLTVFDFLAFQNAFASGDATADCDGDGALSIFDFLCFQNAFASGC